MTENRDTTRDLKQTLADLERLIPIDLPQDFELEVQTSDFAGPDALYHAVKRAVHSFAGGLAVIAKKLDLTPDALERRIEATRAGGGTKGLNANQVQQIVMLTGDPTPYLTLLKGLGLQAFRRPNLGTRPEWLPKLKADQKKIEALLLYVEALVDQCETQSEADEIARLAEKLGAIAGYQQLRLEEAEAGEGVG